METASRPPAAITGPFRTRQPFPDRSHDWVDAAPFTAHLRFLTALPQVSPEVVALLAGVAPRVTRRMLTGDGGRPLRRISPETAGRLYAVTPAVLAECRRRMVPAAPVAARMQQLLAAGWSVADWSGRTQLDSAAVEALLAGLTQSCSYWTALQVRAAAVEVRSVVGVEGVDQLERLPDQSTPRIRVLGPLAA